MDLTTHYYKDWKIFQGIPWREPSAIKPLETLSAAKHFFLNLALGHQYFEIVYKYELNQRILSNFR